MSEEMIYGKEYQPNQIGRASIFELNYEQIELIKKMVESHNQTLKESGDSQVTQHILHQGNQWRIVLKHCPDHLLRQLLSMTKEKPVKGVDYTYEI